VFRIKRTAIGSDGNDWHKKIRTGNVSDVFVVATPPFQAAEMDGQGEYDQKRKRGVRRNTNKHHHSIPGLCNGYETASSALSPESLLWKRHDSFSPSAPLVALLSFTHSSKSGRTVFLNLTLESQTKGSEKRAAACRWSHRVSRCYGCAWTIGIEFTFLGARQSCARVISFCFLLHKQIPLLLYLSNCGFV